MYVCRDRSAAESIAQAARRAAIACARYDDAYAAALGLLRLGRSAARAILLLAADGLSEPELRIARWAAGRWPGLAVWAHGAAAGNLVGREELAAARVVRPGDMERLLAEADSPDRSSPQQAFHVRRMPSPTDLPTAPEPDTELEADDASAEQEAGPTAEAVPSPRLRLHAASASAAEPLLSDEELAVLLAEEGDDAPG